MGLLGKLVKIDTVQAVLVGLGELIGGRSRPRGPASTRQGADAQGCSLPDDKLRLDLFLEMRSSGSDLPFGPLVKWVVRRVTLSVSFLTRPLQGSLAP